MPSSDIMNTMNLNENLQNQANLLNLMKRTGYSMLQENGQRKFGGPPPGWEGPPPSRGCEIFVGKIPRDCYEDELVPVFEKIGNIYELRLMMNFGGENRGYAFVMFSNPHDAARAIRELDNYEIRKGRFLGVCVSVDNCRLFVGGIPKNKKREEILDEMRKITKGVVDVIVYPSVMDKAKNRGFAFVEYDSHKAAAMARRKLIPGRIQLWGHQIAVDWAEPEKEVEDDIMSKVRNLYVRNLMVSTSEESIEKLFENFLGRPGAIEKVKKINDYAFVHFKDREDATRCMEELNGAMLDDSKIEITLAKPPDKAAKQAKNNISVLNCAGMGFFSPPLGGQLFGGQAGAPFFQGTPLTLSSPTGSHFSPLGTGRTAAGMKTLRTPQRMGGIRNATGMKMNRVTELMNGMSLKHPQLKSPQQLLAEVCHQRGWSNPEYTVYTPWYESNTPSLYMCKVVVQDISLVSQDHPLVATQEEARNTAALCALSQLGIGMVAAGRAMAMPPHSLSSYFTQEMPPTSSVPSHYIQPQPVGIQPTTQMMAAEYFAAC